MTKTQALTSVMAYQDGRVVASYRSVTAMADDLGVRVYYETFCTGTLRRDSITVGRWHAYTEGKYI